MLFQTLLQVLASALAITGVTAELHDRDVYARHIAPGQLRHIAGFQARNAGSFNTDQTAAIERVKRLVSEFAVDDIDGTREACQSAFGVEGCKELQTARRHSPARRGRGSLAARAPDCECADQDPYCEDPQICKYKLNNCNFNKGCGLGGLYVCNGVCD